MATTINPTKPATVGSISAAPLALPARCADRSPRDASGTTETYTAAFGIHLGLESVQVAHKMNRERRSSTHETVDS